MSILKTEWDFLSLPTSTKMKKWKIDANRLIKQIAGDLKPVLATGWKHFSKFPIVEQLIGLALTAFQMLKDVGESCRKSPANLVIQWINLALSFVVFFVYFPEIVSKYFEGFSDINPVIQLIISGVAASIVGAICPSTIQNVFKTTMRQSVTLLIIYLGITAFVFRGFIVELLTRSYNWVCHFVKRLASQLVQTAVRFLFSLTSPA